MHCEIIDRYFNVFLVEIQLKKEDFEIVFGHQNLGRKPVYRSPKRPEYVTDPPLYDQSRGTNKRNYKTMRLK